MALTAAQMADTRRYLGYAAVGTTMPIDANTDVVYVRFGMVNMSLYTRLTTLSAAEEAILTGTYLASLQQLESDILGANGIRQNLDTEKAAVWTHNKDEYADRRALYNGTRRELCAFLGCAPGPGLTATNSVPLVRG